MPLKKIKDLLCLYLNSCQVCRGIASKASISESSDEVRL